ncbi:MAG: hypothetical protein OXT70_12920 [Chloroflexota bacterium]|nr:hypothetical protein [Chloroflexota bacterium]
MIQNQTKRWLALLSAAVLSIGMWASFAASPVAGSEGQDAVAEEAQVETIRLRVTLNDEGEFWASAYRLDDGATELGTALVALDRRFEIIPSSPNCPSIPPYRYGDAVLAEIQLRIWQNADDADELWFSVRPAGASDVVGRTKRLELTSAADGGRFADLLVERALSD